eukprot:417690-Amphidinium_carterae.1
MKSVITGIKMFNTDMDEGAETTKPRLGNNKAPPRRNMYEQKTPMRTHTTMRPMEMTSLTIQQK